MKNNSDGNSSLVYIIFMYVYLQSEKFVNYFDGFYEFDQNFKFKNHYRK